MNVNDNESKSPRSVASHILQKIYAVRGYANLALEAELSRQNMLPADAAFCAALVYGVIERRRTLDYQLDGLLRQPIEKLPAQTLMALRLGLYQLFYMTRVPAHAAINESVALVKRSKAHYTAGLVNAVLRRAQGRGLRLPQGDDDYARSIRYACPDWLCALWRNAYGPETAEDLLGNSFGAEETIIRVNTLKISAEELRVRLDGELAPDLPEVYLPPEAIALRKAGSVQRLPGFAEGLFHVQDTAAQLCCKALAPRPGETVFDLCAAPGGKSFSCAESMSNEGRIVAVDLYPQRVNLIKEGAARLGITCIEAVEGDATDKNLLSKLGKADRVLCDVPCSGLGILRKKPDIREKIFAELDKLPEMQYAILCGGAGCLRSGGTLVYATCTLNPAENENVSQRFLREHPDFQLESQRTLMPHIDKTDGFYFAVLKRMQEAHD